MPNPFKSDLQQLVADLCVIAANDSNFPLISVANPEPSDFDDVNDLLLTVTERLDEWLFRLGERVRSNASCNIDIGTFKSAFTDAVAGNATFEIERAKQDCEEGNQEYSSDRRGWGKAQLAGVD